MTDNNRPPRKPSSPTSRTGPRHAERAPERDDARIAKIMARAGLCSRRDAETWIAAGRVAVNGRTIDSPALNIGPGDRVTVDGMPLPEREPTRLFLFHKPRGVVTTAKDPEGRQTIFDILPRELPRLVTIGRLDINTEGLLLLTNDGGLARVLELPATGWLRRYRVRANGEIAQPALDALAKGISIDGVDYAGIEARLDRVQGANVWLTLGLREGKNREIKRVLDHLGMAVTRLIRISFGPFQLGELPVGAVEEVRPKVLRDQLGDALAREAGVDFSAVDRRHSDEGRSVRDDPGQHARSRSAPRNEPREQRPQRETRRHVSALRTARDEAAAEGRRRTERGSTADRKGRAVAVERVSSARPPERVPDTRNARRFSSERDQAGAERSSRSRAGKPQAWSVRAASPSGLSPDEAVRPPRTDRPSQGRNRFKPAERPDFDARRGPWEADEGAAKRDGSGRPGRGARPGAGPRSKPGASARSEAGAPRPPRRKEDGMRAFGAETRANRGHKGGAGRAGRPGLQRSPGPRGAKPPGRPRPPSGGTRGKPRG